MKDTADIHGVTRPATKASAAPDGPVSRRLWRPPLALLIGCLVALPLCIVLAVEWGALRRQAEADARVLSQMVADRAARSIEAELGVALDAVRVALERDTATGEVQHGPVQQVVRYPASQWRPGAPERVDAAPVDGRLPGAADRARYGERAALRPDAIFVSPLRLDEDGAYLHLWKRLANGTLAVAVVEADFVLAAHGGSGGVSRHSMAILDSEGQVVAWLAGPGMPVEAPQAGTVGAQAAEASVPVVDWRVLVWAHAADMTAAAWTWYAPVLAIGIAALGLAFLLAVLLSRRLLGPIRSAAERIGRGETALAAGRKPDPLVGDVDELLTLLGAVETRLMDWQADRGPRKSNGSGDRARIGQLAGVGHDIRTPLNGIIGMIEAVRETEEDAERRMLLDHAKQSAKILNRLLGDLLDYAKLDAGGTAPQARNVALRDLAQGVGRQFRPLASARGIGFEIAVDDGVPKWIVTDPDRLRRILSTLISNALTFTENGGVRVRFTGIHRAGREDRLELRVKDTGCGIAEDIRPRIYAPFVRGAAGNGRSALGLGLGLSICHRLVQQMGGEIHFTSMVGKGTEFTVTLPIGRADADPDAPDGHGEQE